MNIFIKHLFKIIRFYFYLTKIWICRFPNGNTIDRWILESKIIKELVLSDTYSKIISVGVSWTNCEYYKFFKIDSAKIFKTVDPFHDPNSFEDHAKCRFEHFKSKYIYDAILLSGVFGYGTDTLVEVEHMLQQCSEILSLNGIVVIGAKAKNGRIKSPDFDIYETARQYGLNPTQIPGLKSNFHPTTHHNGHAFYAFRLMSDHKTST